MNRSCNAWGFLSLKGKIDKIEQKKDFAKSTSSTSYHTGLPYLASMMERPLNFATSYDSVHYISTVWQLPLTVI